MLVQRFEALKLISKASEDEGAKQAILSHALKVSNEAFACNIFGTALALVKLALIVAQAK